MKISSVPIDVIKEGNSFLARDYCNPEGGQLDQDLVRHQRRIAASERAIQDLRGRKVEIIERRKRQGIVDL